MVFGSRCKTFLAAILATAIAFASATTSHEVFMQNHLDAVPSILIIGTAKGGTTDLYKQLTDDSVNHAPGRLEPPFPAISIKEPAILNRGGITGKLLPLQPLYFEFLQLLNHPCSRVPADIFQECMATSGTKQLTLDATPDYCFSHVAPVYLRGLSPLSKIIMMVREPVERAEVLFRHFKLTQGKWMDKSIDTLTLDFLNYVRTESDVLTSLQRAVDCPLADVPCQANSWREISIKPLMRSVDYVLFMGGLYRYMLAVWRQEYFQPGRVLVVESQAYYERRGEVMEKVIRYLYGRSMLPEERKLAASEVVWRKYGVPSLTGVKLSPSVRQQLETFYDQHVMQGFFRMLTDMQAEGAWVVGFDDLPWDKYPGFAEFNGRSTYQR